MPRGGRLALLIVALLASACSDDGAERPTAAPTTETSAPAAVVADISTTSKATSHDQQRPDSTAGTESDADDGTAAAPIDDSEAPAHDEDATDPQEGADAAGQEEHDPPREEPTPEELAALRAAFNPLMPGGGVLAGYEYYWCALTSEGHIECWGWGWGPPDDRQEPPLGVFTAIGVGRYFACAIRADKTLVCWGEERYSDREFATPDGEFTSVTVGTYDACAIRIDATVACWNPYDASETVPGNTRGPDGEFVSVAARHEHTCGVRADGELQCWGLIDRDQRHPADGQFISVAGSCAIRADRSLACWDRTRDPNSFSSFPYRTPYGEFHSVSATGNQGCAVALDGELVCWGYEAVLNRNSEILSGQYITVAVNTLGANGACALAVDGHIRCLGGYSPPGGPFGPGRETVQLPGYDAIGDTNGADEPSARARRIGIGDDFMCLLQADSTIRCFGSFEQWYHDTGEVVDAVAPPGRFVSVVAGSNYACALTTERTAVCWGPGSQMRDVRWGDPLGPGAIPAGTFSLLATGVGQTCGLRDDRSVECWSNGEGRLLVTPSGTYVDIAAGSGYACALRDDGVIVCWRNAYGEHETWQHAAPSGRYTKVTSGAHHYCGIRDDNLFTCWWGSVSESDPRVYGIHGRGEDRQAWVFAAFTDVAPGGSHTCGLRPDAAIVCWDRFGSEHLDPPGGEFYEIYSGSDTSCAVDAQGAATCWGDLANALSRLPETGEVQFTGTSAP